MTTKDGKSKDGEFDYVLYYPDPEEEEEGGLYIHIGGMSIGLAGEFKYLEQLAEALEHVEITDLD